VEHRFVESVDIVPTLLDALGLERPAHRLEGESLLPLLRGNAPAWRDSVYSELDYSFKQARLRLGKTSHNARAWSLRNARWRYVHWLDAPEQLYDLQSDPGEMHDLGRDAGTQGQRDALRTQLFDWLARRKRRTTISDALVERGTHAHKRAGVYFGQW
jgi:arylsulfatase A-like enzyme